MNVNTLPNGTEVHFTNWPGRPSVAVTVDHHSDGNIRFANGRRLFAFDDEVFGQPVTGLEGTPVTGTVSA